jgi:hypothetical protein
LPLDRADISVMTTDARWPVWSTRCVRYGDNGAARIPSEGWHVNDAEPPSVDDVL